jgi:sulfatase modifying factor 1
VPAGSFMMGSPAAEIGREDDEGPRHEVRLSAFSIGRYEVTVGEFRAFVQATGYRTTAEREGGSDALVEGSWIRIAGASWKAPPYIVQGDGDPVVLVSWYDSVEYCNWRSNQEGLGPCYTIRGENVSCDFSADGYRLPTEAEWEYAAKGGPAAGGLALNEVYAGSAELHGVAWYSGNSGGKTHPVGQKKANALGLYDMAGNVWEWCWDWYAAEYPGGSPSADPSGAPSGDHRVNRGGGWNNDGPGFRSANRAYEPPDKRYRSLGFRLLRRSLSPRRERFPLL